MTPPPANPGGPRRDPLWLTLRSRGIWLPGSVLLAGMLTLFGVSYALEMREARTVEDDFKAAHLRWTEAAASLVQARLEGGRGGVAPRGSDGDPGRALEPALFQSLRSIEQSDMLRVFLKPPEGGWLDAHGMPARSAILAQSEPLGLHWHDLARTEAPALGLPERKAILSFASTLDPSGRPWIVAVAGTAYREHDRAQQARVRLVLAFLTRLVLMVLVAWWALRLRLRERAFGKELALRDQGRRKDQELSQANRAATVLAFASGVAHEVSTPLGVITARASQLIQRLKEDERGTRQAQAIQEEVQRIHKSLRRFLDLARGGGLSQEAIDPVTLAQGAVALVDHRFQSAGVGLVTEVPAGLPRLKGDANLLEHLLVNLLLNACDASAPGDRVVLRIEAEGERLALEVLDEGTGIPPQVLERIGEPFFTTKPQGKGTGMGLAIAREIAHMHHGSIQLEPRRPRGTRARAQLPKA